MLRAWRSHSGYDTWRRRTEMPLLLLSLLFLVVLLLPLVHPGGALQSTLLTTASIVIWAVFAVDYVARLYLSPARLTFVRTHVLDLVVLALPMLGPLRAVRLLRLLRVASVIGVLHQRGERSLHARVGAYVAGAVVVIVTVAAAAMYDVERHAPGSNIKSLPDALWWAATTVTTVGYGDRYPTTGLGRLVAVALMLVGIALLGGVSASIAASFVARLRGVEEREARTAELLQEVLAEVRALRAERPE